MRIGEQFHAISVTPYVRGRGSNAGNLVHRDMLDEDGRVIGVRVDSNDDLGFWIEAFFPKTSQTKESVMKEDEDDGDDDDEDGDDEDEDDIIYIMATTTRMTRMTMRRRTRPRTNVRSPLNMSASDNYAKTQESLVLLMTLPLVSGGGR